MFKEEPVLLHEDQGMELLWGEDRQLTVLVTFLTMKIIKWWLGFRHGMASLLLLFSKAQGHLNQLLNVRCSFTNIGNLNIIISTLYRRQLSQRG